MNDVREFVVVEVVLGGRPCGVWLSVVLGVVVDDGWFASSVEVSSSSTVSQVRTMPSNKTQSIITKWKSILISFFTKNRCRLNPKSILHTGIIDYPTHKIDYPFVSLVEIDFLPSRMGVGYFFICTLSWLSSLIYVYMLGFIYVYVLCFSFHTPF